MERQYGTQSFRGEAEPRVPSRRPWLRGHSAIHGQRFTSGITRRFGEAPTKVSGRASEC